MSRKFLDLLRVLGAVVVAAPVYAASGYPIWAAGYAAAGWSISSDGTHFERISPFITSLPIYIQLGVLAAGLGVGSIMLARVILRKKPLSHWLWLGSPPFFCVVAIMVLDLLTYFR